jgi:hypothetical protein
MQDRIARIDETSCTARPDHTYGSFATSACFEDVRFGPDSDREAGMTEIDVKGQ